MNKQPINDKYISEINNGLSIWDIVEKYNDTYKNVSESITGHRFEARFLPKEEKEKICQLYQSGISTVKIGKMYGVNNKPIAVVLEDFNIKRNQGEMVRKYAVNQTYFDIIDNPNKAYIIGFLSADGSNNPTKQTISMALEECDKEILEKICKEMGNEHPLEFLDYSSKHDFGYTYKNQYRMLICSAYICSRLSEIGVIPNKSLSLEFSNSIPEQYYSHYVRGIFDGDGSIGVKNLQAYKGNIDISITSTKMVCERIQNILKALDIESYVCEASNHNGITAVLNIHKNESKKKFLDWIYADAELYLFRKYQVYMFHYYSKLVA